jgi:polyisoprenoid-binding protein YceI
MVADGTWQVDPLQTLVHLRARVLGIPANCKVDVRSGTASVRGSGMRAELRATLDLTTFRSGIDRRDEHVRSADFLDVANHPLATFEAEWDGDAATPTEVTGRLTIGAVTAPVTVRFELAEQTDSTLTFTGTARVSRRALGVARVRFVLADAVDVVVRGSATRVGSAASTPDTYDDATATPSTLTRGG